MSRTWHTWRLMRLTGSKRFSWSCRNHGACGYCYNNRMYQSFKAIPCDEEQSIIDALNGDWRDDCWEDWQSGNAPVC